MAKENSGLAADSFLATNESSAGFVPFVAGFDVVVKLFDKEEAVLEVVLDGAFEKLKLFPASFDSVALSPKRRQ